MCCGQKRKALRTRAMPDLPGVSAGKTLEVDQASASALEVDLLYLLQSPIQLREMATGRLYQFSSSQPVQAVDPRDATVILRTHLFRQMT